MKLAEAMFAFHLAESFFGEAMVDAGFGDYEKIGGDDYDNSIEFLGVGNDARMPEAAQRVVFDAGFTRAYLNHKDGWETHYSWRRGEFAPYRGWRRRYVIDPSVETTRAIGGGHPEDNGYYEISYWPEGWGDQYTGRNAGWLTSGYMRIVPDPLDANNQSSISGTKP